MTTTMETSGRLAGSILGEFHVAVAAFDIRGWHAVAEALRSLLVAMEYQDRPLVRSHLETALAALTEAAGGHIGELLDRCRLIRSQCRRVAEAGGSPGVEFDELGRMFAGTLTGLVSELTKVRDGLVRQLHSVGAEFPLGKALEAEIRELESFRASLTDGWPWSHLPLPPSDPAMLAASRAEVERGEGIPIDELIRAIEVAGAPGNAGA